MLFEGIVGNESIKQYLRHMVAKDCVGNSLLFAGPDGVGKGLFALELAKAILSKDDPSGSHLGKLASGNHPDIHIYRPEGKVGMHSIDQLRRFTEEVYLYPYEAKKKVFILHDADRMSGVSANALLKTFEEPSEDSVIILLSRAPESILPTILSRCRKVYFKPVAETQIRALLQSQTEISEQEMDLISGLAGGSVVRALEWARKGLDPKREKVISLLKEGGHVPYGQVHQVAKELAEQIDSVKDAVAAEMRQRLMAQYQDPKSVTATQRQSIEREVEGASTLRVVQEVNGVLEVVMAWFRDLQAVHGGMDRNACFNRDQETALLGLVRRGGFPSWEQVEKAVKEVQLAVARSSPLGPSLEALFLQLA